MRYTAVHNGKPVFVKIEYDEFPENHLEQWGAYAPIIACGHRRYVLGHEDGKARVKNLIRDSRLYYDSWEEEDFYTPSNGWRLNPRYLDFDNWQDLATAAQRTDCMVRLISLYDHPGLAVSLEGVQYPFTCHWDTGVVGIMVWSREQREAYHSDAFRNTERQQETDENIFQQFFDDWKQYIEGDIYRVTLFDAVTGAVIDSCGGLCDWDYVIDQALRDIFDLDPKTLEECGQKQTA